MSEPKMQPTETDRDRERLLIAVVRLYQSAQDRAEEALGQVAATRFMLGEMMHVRGLTYFKSTGGIEIRGGKTGSFNVVDPKRPRSWRRP